MTYVEKVSSVIASGIFMFGLAGAVHAQQDSAARHDHGTKPASLRAMMGEASGSEGKMCSTCNRSQQGGSKGMNGSMCMQRMGGMMSHNQAMPAHHSAGALDTAELAAMVPLDVSDAMHDLAGEEIKHIQAQLSRKQAVAEGKMLKAKGELQIALATERVDRQAVASALRSYADAQSELLQARLEAKAELRALTAPAAR